MAPYTLSIKKIFGMEIADGRKLFEARRTKDIKQNLEGRSIAFHWFTSTRVVCEVLSVTKFDNATNMVRQIGHRELVPSSETPQQCCASWVYYFCIKPNHFLKLIISQCSSQPA